LIECVNGECFDRKDKLGYYLDTIDTTKLIYCDQNGCNKIEFERPGYYFNSATTDYVVKCTTNNCEIEYNIEGSSIGEKCSNEENKDTVYYVEDSTLTYCLNNINGNYESIDMPKKDEDDNYEKYYVVNFNKEKNEHGYVFPDIKPNESNASNDGRIIIKVTKYSITQYYYTESDNNIDNSNENGNGSEGKNKW